MTTVMIADRNALQKSAQRHLTAGRISQAIEDLLKILRDHPNDFSLMMQIAELYLQTGKSAQAIPLFQRVAEHHCAEGFLLKAIAIYKRILRLNPGLVETRIQLADLDIRQGLTTEARFELLAAVDYYERRRQSRDTIRMYQKLMELTPGDLEGRGELARIYEREGMVSEAVGQYLELSTLSIQQGQVAGGLASLEKARRLNPRNAAVLWKMLWIYLEQDEFEKAGGLLEEFTAINPSDPEMLGLIVKTFSQPSQLERMLDLVNRALAAAPGRESLLVLKGELFLRLGNTEAAYAEFVNAMEGMLSHGEPNRAIVLARRMVRFDSSFHPALELLVDLYIEQGLGSHLPGAYAALADAYIAHSMYADARKCLEKLLELEPRNRQHREKLEHVLSILEPPETVRKEAGGTEAGEFDLEISMDEIDPESQTRDEPESETQPPPGATDDTKSGINM